jgi:hypothetical protein
LMIPCSKVVKIALFFMVLGWSVFKFCMVCDKLKVWNTTHVVTSLKCGTQFMLWSSSWLDATSNEFHPLALAFGLAIHSCLHFTWSFVLFMSLLSLSWVEVLVMICNHFHCVCVNGNNSHHVIHVIFIIMFVLSIIIIIGNNSRCGHLILYCGWLIHYHGCHHHVHDHGC